MDRAIRDIELEGAIGAVVVFPAVVTLGEVVVAEGFNRVPEVLPS